MKLYWSNSIDAAAAVITPVTQATAFPAVNLANPQRTRIYRTLGTTATEAIVFDLGSAQAITSLILLDHTILATATLTLEANATDSWGGPSYSSAITWTTSWILKTLSQTYRYWRIKVVKAASAETFDIGRVFIGPATTVTGAVDYNGLDRDRLDLTVSQRSAGGQLYSDPRPQARTYAADCSGIADADATTLDSIAHTIGLHTPFFIQLDETGSGFLAEPIYVKFRDVPKLKNAGFDSELKWDTTLKLEENL